MKGKYMAYVGSYSYTGKAKGITVFDVDLEKGLFIPRCEEAVNNASYLVASNNGKVLYSIADEGVVSFRILENGSLARLNTAGIRGMRGCHLSTDASDKYLFVSGFHDGKSTVLRLNKDGSVGEIVDAVFHKGLGTVAERTFRPHITCTRRTPDNKFVMMADSGIDQVKIYRFSEQHEQLTLVDAIRCDLESAPKCFRFSSDGKFIYLVYAPCASPTTRATCSAATPETIPSASTTGTRRRDFWSSSAACLSAATIPRISRCSRMTSTSPPSTTAATSPSSGWTTRRGCW